MRAWKFFGSIDGVKYTLIDEKPINKDLESNKIGHYSVEQGIYKHFKIMQTVETLYPKINMRISKFELFGTLLHSIACKTIYHKTRIPYLCFHLIYIISIKQD